MDKKKIGAGFAGALQKAADAAKAAKLAVQDMAADAKQSREKKKADAQKAAAAKELITAAESEKGTAPVMKSIATRNALQMNDINSLAHTKWNCKYHIVFAPKYRRKVFYQEKREAVGKILRRLCEWKGVRIVEAEVCPDHIHMLVEIPPKIAVSSFMGYLKGKSSTMLYEQFGELKYKYRNREFWCKGYYVDTVGKNESRIAEYIENQLKEDEMGEQLTMSQYGPFTGGK